VSRLPPRPDIGAAAVAAAAAVAVYLASGSPGGAFFAGVIAGLFSLPLLLLAREFALFRARKVLEPREAGLVADWIAAAGAAVGAGDVSVLYTYRRGAGIQVVQLGSTVSQEEAQAGLLALLHRAAWSALPAAAVTRRGKLMVAVPARIMETLYALAGRGRDGPYLELRRAGHARLVYGVLRELAGAVNRGAGRAYTAYLATKAFARMMLAGRIRVAPGLVDRLDRMVPWEPWWVRRRVMRQLAEESGLAVQP
jgi:hypothetical protein